MRRWPYKVEKYTQKEVQEHCVRDSDWQAFRQTLKGLSTSRKLDKLDSWYIDVGTTHVERRSVQVQVDNYLQALRRGGFLNERFEVVRG